MSASGDGRAARRRAAARPAVRARRAARHQSLAAAIDWSYRLLSTAGAAAVRPAVGVRRRRRPGRGARGVRRTRRTEADTLDLLTALVDKSMVARRARLGGTRYRVLETLRAYGRDACSSDDARARAGTPAYFTDLAEEAARGVQGPDERAWVERTLPDFGQPAGGVRAGHGRRATPTSRCGWSPRCAELTADPARLRGGRLGRAGARLAPAGPPAVRRRRRRGGAGRVEPRRLRTGPARLAAPGRRPASRPGYRAHRPIPATCSPTSALYEGDVDAALRHYDVGGGRAPAGDDDPIRLVWTLYYVAICHAVRRRPSVGRRRRARRACAVADATANPTARSMARYALGLVLKKSDPDRALALFDEAAELAASVHNFWWQGIALMEAAATRARPRRPARAARELSSRSSTTGTGRRLDPAVAQPALRHPAAGPARRGGGRRRAAPRLVAAGKPSPLRDVGPAVAVPRTAADAVAYARTALTRHL